MKKLYILTCLLLIGAFGIQELEAQKSLRIRISNVQNSPGTDCDGALAGESDWEWQFNTTGSDPCIERDNNSANNFNPDVTVFGTNYYYSRECWPTGNFTIGFRGLEDDGASNCDNDCGQSYTNTSRAYRAYNTANNTYTDWNNLSYSTTCGCQGEGAGGSDVTITYRYSAQQIVGGSFSGTNLDGNYYVNNKTACTAANLGSGTSLGATGNYVTQCTETWYYYNLTSNRSDLTFNPSQNSGSLYIYYSATNSCSDLCYRASSGGGSVTLRAAPAGRYYFRQLASGGGNTNIAISSTGASNDEIQFATVVTPSTGNFTFNNSGYTEQSGEPEPAGDIFGTGWYTFVTPAGGYNSVTASMQTAGGGSENIAIAIYRYNSTNCSNDFGTNLTTIVSDRWCADNDDQVTTYCLPGNTRYYVQFGTSENFAACTDLLNGTPSTGTYTVSINSSGTSPSNNDICNALPLGGAELIAGESDNNNRPSLRCMNRQGGEPEGDILNTVWYYFTTPAAGLASVDLNWNEHADGADNPALALYRSSAGTSCPTFAQLTKVADNISINPLDVNADINYECLQGGTRYYVQAGYNDRPLDGGEPGTFDLDISANSYATGPDEPCSATTNFTINSTSGSASINNQTNICAGAAGSEPGGGQQTVWYRFTTGATVGYNFNINMDAKTNGLNADVYVYEACAGCSYGGLTELDNFFDVNPLPGEFDAGGTISGKVKPNTTYYIRADGVPTVGVDGGFDLDMSWSGTFNNNDDFCNALNVGSGTLTTSGTLTASNFNNYTASAQETCALDEPNVDNDDETVWFKFTTTSTPPASIDIDVSADGGTGSGGTLCVAGEIAAGWVKVYEADGSPALPGSCAGWTTSTNWFNGIVEPANVSIGLDVSDLTIDCPKASTTYYIQVETGGLATCDKAQFDLVVTGNGAIQVGDVCTQATPLSGSALTLGGTIGNAGAVYSNICAGPDAAPSGCGFSIQHGVWFSFTTAANVGGYVDVYGYNNGGDDLDLQLVVYEGPCGSLSEIKCDYDPTLTLVCGLGLCDEDLTSVCVEPSKTYYILVDGGGLFAALEQGTFGLQVVDQVEPANDQICNAEPVTVSPIYTYNKATKTNQSNVNGSNCFEPQPNWIPELCTDNDAGVWYSFGQVPGRTIVMDATNTGADDISLQAALYSTTTNNCNAAKTLVQVENNLLTNREVGYFNCLNPNLYYWMLIDGGDYDPTCLGIISALEEGTFDLEFWFPEEGEVTFCNAETMGGGAQIPNGGSQERLNLSNKCGAGSTAGMSSGTVTIPSSFTLDNAVLYSFVAPNSGSVLVEATSNPYYSDGTNGIGYNEDLITLGGDEVDLQLAIFEASQYTNCATADYYPKGSYYDPTDGFNERLIVNCLVAGRTYWIMVDGSGLNSSGYFDLKISDYGKQTPNDFLCNAIDIAGTFAPIWSTCNYTGSTSLNFQNNYCATLSNDLPSSLGGIPPAWNTAQSGVWYRFKAPKSGKVEFQVENSISDLLPPYDEPEISAQLAVFFLPGGYQGGCGALSTEKERLVYIESDYDGLLHGEDMTVECLMPDSIYYLFVDGTTSLGCPTCDRGEFDITIISDGRDIPAQNEVPCRAIPLGQPVQGTTIVGTRIGTGGVNLIPTTGYGNGTQPRSSMCMRAENNFCKNTAGEPGVSGGTFLTDFSPDQTVWYEFIAPATGEILINAYNDPTSVGDQIDLQLAVYESSDNTCTGTLVPIKAEYNIGFFSEEMRVQCLEPGQKYWLLVDGSGLNVQGYFEIGIEAVTATLSGPPNDDICAAGVPNLAYPATIGGTTSLSNQTNRCATIEIGTYPDPTTFSTDADVWYTFTTPNTAGPHSVEISVTSGLPWPFGDAIDPQIALYEGSCPTSFTLVEDDYSPIGLPFYESFEFHCLEQNTKYWIMVDGSGLNEQGNFNIEMQRISPHPLPTNDDICSSGTTTANGDLGTLGGSGSIIGNTTTNWHNFCSDVETNEGTLMTDGNFSLDQTVWFHFNSGTGTNNKNIEIRALNDPNNVGDQIDLQMLLLQGNPSCPFNAASTWSGLSPIESDDPVFTFNSTLSLCVAPNQDYWILVDGSGLNTQGYFTIEVENMGTTVGPPNDNICNAKNLPASGVITGSYTGYANDNNICATLESNEVMQDPGGIQRSVWYKFVAPTSADVSIEVVGNSWIPFTTDYFLPDVTIWELNAGTYASPATAIAGCPNPALGNWNTLEYNDYQVIPNSLANGVYPTVVLTPLCLKPGYTYYVQVDGVAGIGLDGYFEINIRDNQLPYSGPSNNEVSGATLLTVGTESCQEAGGTWSAYFDYGDNPTWSNPSLIGNAVPSCASNCGDTWYKFQMPAPCGNHTQSFVKVEGNDEDGLDWSQLTIAAYNGGPTTSTGSLTFLECSSGGFGSDPAISISGNGGDWIYLQVWDNDGDEQDERFQLCVFEQISSDDCADATDMTLDIPYCFRVAAHEGETPSAAVVGSGLHSFCGVNDPEHSTYFKFTTDVANEFCDDYYMYINLPGLAKEIAGASLSNCFGSTAPSVEFSATIWEVLPGGIECTPGASNTIQRDCYIFNDCGTGSFGSNVTGPHGNGGIINDTIYFDLNSTFQFQPNTTYYIVLDYSTPGIPSFAGRVVLDGTIEVGRRCKGRIYEYATPSAIPGTVTTSQYCTMGDGWRHYYDDKGTPNVTSDDRYLFSLYPNGNDIEGTASITLLPNYTAAEDLVGPDLAATYTMRRYWDFDITSGTIDPAKPVGVRFYYQQSEKDEIIAAAQLFALFPSLVVEPFEWFKTQNGVDFHPSQVHPRYIESKQWSETGQFTPFVFTDSSGVGHFAEDYDEDNTNISCNGIQYVEMWGLTGFSGGTGSTGASDSLQSPLPVELISFVGWNNGDVNELEWITATEINNEVFVVERSIDAINFIEIGKVPGNGTTTEEQKYAFTDAAPIEGINYYRLKQIDFDGSFEYSDIIAVEVSGDILRTAIVKLHPNPTNRIINIQLQAANKTAFEMNVMDITGRLMETRTISAEKGLNSPFALNVEEYRSGIYIISLFDVNTGERLEAKFVRE
ncbi:MAG: T9SS type A sorting domain-containing protein [Chitinophagales bacterium]